MIVWMIRLDRHENAWWQSIHLVEAFVDQHWHQGPQQEGRFLKTKSRRRETVQPRGTQPWGGSSHVRRKKDGEPRPPEALLETLGENPSGHPSTPGPGLEGLRGVEPGFVAGRDLWRRGLSPTSLVIGSPRRLRAHFLIGAAMYWDVRAV
jgi:hypothetical protein